MSGLPIQPEGERPGGRSGGQARGPDQRLGRARRLTRSADIQDAFSQQQKWVGSFMVLWLRSAETACGRLAVVSSRKVGGAVERNRARRRLREMFRRNRDQLTGRHDVVLIARRDVLRASADAIRRDFLGLAARAGIGKPQ